MPYNLPNRLNKQQATNLLSKVDNFLFDCDGVLWHWPNIIPGSIECINKLKSLGKKCYFITNNSTKTRQTYFEMIQKVGVNNASIDDIVCTAWILARYLKSIDFKHKIYTIGSPAMGTELDNLELRHIGIGCNRHLFPDPAKCNYSEVMKLKLFFKR
jgi:HAD superfamily hydrolase (TIGR01450 family)